MGRIESRTSEPPRFTKVLWRWNRTSSVFFIDGITRSSNFLDPILRTRPEEPLRVSGRCEVAAVRYLLRRLGLGGTAEEGEE